MNEDTNEKTPMKPHVSYSHDSDARQLFLIRAINYFRSRKGESCLNKRKIALLALVPLYLISPIDVIPDVLPVLGQLDDLALIPFALVALFMPRLKNGVTPRSKN